MKLLLLFIITTTSLVNYNPRHPGDSISQNQMERTSLQVFNNLKRAKGILPNEAPRLSIYKFGGSSKLASMHLDKGEIHLDSRSYELCRGMGPDSLNALAFILGHELGHYINSHGGVNHNIVDAAPEDVVSFNVVNEVINTSTVGDVAELESKMQNALEEYRETHDEAEADFEGAFLGYLAGYETRQAGQEFLRRAYQRFDLNDNTTGYPTLNERIAIVKKTAQDLEQLTPLFDIAKHLLAIGKYAEAAPLLERILTKFESPEIYNNLGVIHTLQLTSTFPHNITQFYLPLTYDAEFRAPHPQFFGMILPDEFETITQSRITLPPCQPNELHKQLEIAEGYLQKAILLDPDYALAFLNLSIVQTLKGKLYSIDNYMDQLDEDEKMPNCLQAQWDEYEIALGNALSARTYAAIGLAGHTLTYHSLAIPGRDNNDDLGPAHFQESFGTTSFKSEEHRGMTMGPSRTFWSSTNGIVPDEAVLLANVWTQIDVLRLLLKKDELGKLEYVSPDQNRSKSKFPAFTRSLKLDPSNQYALLNKAILTGDSSHMQTEVINDQNLCNLTESIGNTHIQEIINETAAWDHTTSFTASSFYAYYTSEMGIDKRDNDKIHRGSFPTDITTSSVYSNDKTLYKYTSTVNNDKINQTQTILFGIPNKVSVTACNLKLNDNLEQTITSYGQPSHSLSTNLGQLHAFRLIDSVAVEEKELDIMNFLDPEAPLISKLTKEQEGLIFHFNNLSSILGWTIYHTSTVSELEL